MGKYHRYMPIEDRLWGRTVETETGCWEFTGGKVTFGYGWIRYKGQGVATHRLSYQLTYGPIPEGLWVLHKCDNAPCIRPDHLFLGTPLDNVRDMIAKGRRVLPKDTQAYRRRWTHCRRGHEFTPENTYERPEGRRCKTCRSEASRRARKSGEPSSPPQTETGTPLARRE